MNPFSRTVAGVVAAALFSVSIAAPADARPRGRWYHHHNHVSTGEVIAGIAIIGGIAAIASAASRNRARYETSYARYENPYRTVVNSCGYEADEAYGRGSVRVTDVQQLDRDYFRVTGVVDRGGGYFDREEPVYEPTAYEEQAVEDTPYATEDPTDESTAVFGEERYYDAEAHRREREQQQRQVQRQDDSFTFSCVALGNGRIVEFAANDR